MKQARLLDWNLVFSVKQPGRYIAVHQIGFGLLMSMRDLKVKCECFAAFYFLGNALLAAEKPSDLMERVC